MTRTAVGAPLLVVDELGSQPLEIDKTPGDQLWGGFTRDGKRLYYANVDAGGKATLRAFAFDTVLPDS